MRRSGTDVPPFQAVNENLCFLICFSLARGSPLFSAPVTVYGFWGPLENYYRYSPVEVKLLLLRLETFGRERVKKKPTKSTKTRLEGFSDP